MSRRATRRSTVASPLRLRVIQASATDEEDLKLADEISWDEDENENDGPEDDKPVYRIGTRAQIPAVAQAISEIVINRAVPFAERRADLEVLIRQVADPDEARLMPLSRQNGWNVVDCDLCIAATPGARGQALVISDDDQARIIDPRLEVIHLPMSAGQLESGVALGQVPRVAFGDHKRNRRSY